MLAKSSRLSKQDIDLLFKHGDSFRTPLVSIRTRRTNEPGARFCILFSKNMKLSSTERNRIRRQTYSQIRVRMEKFTPGKDYGIMITPRLLTLTAKERTDAVEKVLERLS